MNQKVHSAVDVANYIVNYCIDREHPVSNLKLQKLLYYVQAASLVNSNTSIFSDEISAWKYGPVVEPVYHKFKIYVDKSITEKVTERGMFLLENDQEVYDPSALFSDDEKTLISKVIDSYDNYTAIGMVKKTHKEDPWKDAYDKGNDYIRTKDIQKFYEKNQGLIYGAQ